MVMEQHVSELMAERVGFKKDIAMEKLAEATFNAEVARESLMFPAEDLYGSNWNTRWVDPFRGRRRKQTSLILARLIALPSFIRLIL